uniref:Desmoglein-2-like n=1 Tax=Stegastes partitus TaxID=144197 RepID=A0A3B5B005_9TELE
KRHWITPPKLLIENKDYTNEKSVARVSHGCLRNVIYSLKGRGASQHPFHVFVVDPLSGLIRVTKLLDREFIDMYNLTGFAHFLNGTLAEDAIDIIFKIVDVNDNPPVFQPMKPAEVDELSPIGTSVMQLLAIDADEALNNNSLIAFSIIDQKPPEDMFYVNRTGTIFVKKPTLDREKTKQYILTVKGRDEDGAPRGKTATSSVTINIRDVNDNLPTLEKDEYEASINENSQGVEVLRIKAQDLDQESTDNWAAVYDIVQGNDDGYFSIKTDPKTNEGILMLDKPVDYENVKDLNLGLIVKNKAPLFGRPGGGGSKPGTGGGTGGGGGGGRPSRPSRPSRPTGAGGSPSKKKFKTYPIKIDVKNLPDPPRFQPKVKAIPVSEGPDSVNTNDVIATYPAVDGDTGEPVENVRYAKGSDPENWLSIDPETAEIRLNKIPDRESPALVNGTYFAEVLAITDGTLPLSKTATGTIAIQVEDFNDNCPSLTSHFETICTTANAVNVTAHDEDADPNGSPLDFVIVPEGTRGKWQVEHLNETAAILRAQESLWTGLYEVEFVIKDKQGLACPEPQKMRIQVCVCDDGVMCRERSASSQHSKRTELGSAAIGLAVLGLLLLLLIPLLMLVCQCGDTAHFPDLFAEMPFDTKTRLINYHTEHLGEKPEVPLLDMPKQAERHMVSMGMGAPKKSVAIAPLSPVDFHQSVTSVNEMNGAPFQEDFISVHREGMQSMNQVDSFGFSAEFEGRESQGGGELYDYMALPDYFLGQYYSQATNRNDNTQVKDGLMMYEDEGQGSSAGSVGCCSLLESDDDLQFLDDLGMKFKTLAEVCGGKKITIAAQQLPPPPKVETVEPSQLVKASTSIVREGMTTVRTGMENHNQMLLLQQQQQQQQQQQPQPQPVYYNSVPLLQPMRYVIQPQVQNTVLLAEAPSTNIQGMVLVHDTQAVSSPGVFIQGQTVMSGGQAQGSGMVLVENNGIHGSCANLIHTGNISKVNESCANLIQRSNSSDVNGSCAKLIQRSNSSDVNGSCRRSPGSKEVPTAKASRSLSVGATSIL